MKNNGSPFARVNVQLALSFHVPSRGSLLHWETTPGAPALVQGHHQISNEHLPSDLCLRFDLSFFPLVILATQPSRFQFRGSQGSEKHYFSCITLTSTVPFQSSCAVHMQWKKCYL